MPTGTKIAAIVLVVLLGATGLYYALVAPPASNNASKSTAGKEPSTAGLNSQTPSTLAPGGAKPAQPTFTVVPNSTLPGAAGGTGPAPATAGATTARGDQPGVVPGTLAPAGAGKSDAPGALPPGALSGNTGTTVRPGAAPTGAAGTTGNATFGAAGTPTGSNTPGNGLAGNTPGTGPAPAGTAPSAGAPVGNGFNGFPPTGGAGTGLAAGNGGVPNGPTPAGARAPGAAGTTPGFGNTPTGGAGSAPQASSEKTHVIASGDTLGAIAKRYYGSEAKWDIIRKANPMVNPNNLKIGTKLRIPDATTLASAPSTTTPGVGSTGVAAGSSGSNLSGSTSGGTTASSGNGSTHTVASGDTLAAISRKYYGSDKFWEKIYSANKGTIGSNPANLKIGQKLSIPAKTVVVGGENVER